jgi:hypothetical protein
MGAKNVSSSKLVHGFDLSEGPQRMPRDYQVALYSQPAIEEPLVPIATDPSPNHAFGGNSCPGGPLEPIETQDHNEAGGRQSENQRTSHCSILSIFVVHDSSPNHSGCE